MSKHPLDRVQELAGLATYAEAARAGYSVDDSVRRLLRFHWMERLLMPSRASQMFVAAPALSHYITI